MQDADPVVATDPTALLEQDTWVDSGIVPDPQFTQVDCPVKEV